MNKFGQNLHKFVAKLLSTGYCLKDMLTFLGLDYKELMILWSVVLGIRFQKIRYIG